MTDQSKSKPSDRIKVESISSPSIGEGGIGWGRNKEVPYAVDVRREMDALHERLGMIEELLTDAHVIKTKETVAFVKKPEPNQPKWQTGDYNTNLNHSGVISSNAEPKQEPKCNHSNALSANHCYKCGLHIDKWEKSTEKKESLAEVLHQITGVAPKIITKEDAHNLAETAIEAVEKVMNEYYGGHEEDFKRFLRKRLL